MASQVIYQSPPLDNTGSWAWTLSANLQNFNRLSRENLQRELDIHQSVQKQIGKPFQSVNLQQFCSTEPQNQVLENTSYLHKNSTSHVGSVRNTSTVSKSSEMPEYFLGHELQTPVEKLNFDTCKLAQENFENERRQILLKEFSNPEIQSLQSKIQSVNSKIKRLRSKEKVSTKPLLTKAIYTENKPTDSKAIYTENKPTDSKAKKTAEEPNSWIQTFNKDVMCFLCQKTVKADHLGEHLFFGAVRCTHCNREVLNCQSFQLLIVNSIMGIESCTHSLRYCYDPFDYIRSRLSDKATSNSSSSFVPMYLLKRLSLYVGSMDSLKNKEPWGPALIQCKKHLSSEIKSKGHTKSVTNENTNAGKSKTKLAAKTSKQTSSKDNQSIGGGSLPPEAKNVARQVTCSTLINQNGFGSRASEDAVVDLLLSQNYDLEQLEQAVEYVEVTGHSKLQNSSLSRKPEKKPRPYKKRKQIDKSLLSPLVIGKDQPEDEEMCTEFIETPANGYYYVVRKAIEECPMCYTVLCPSEFTVNVETFLMTTICSGCDLTIYIVLDSPDGSVTGVSIVTEEEPENEPKSVEVTEKKKRKYTKPKKPVKTSRASDFFAK
nr:uncharacterized protein LOC123771050 [Procambarus clarkii]XP_045619286.1 uncharacterized protein LOC123771050 [Procambarus clarkii]